MDFPTTLHRVGSCSSVEFTGHRAEFDRLHGPEGGDGQGGLLEPGRALVEGPPAAADGADDHRDAESERDDALAGASKAGDGQAEAGHGEDDDDAEQNVGSGNVDFGSSDLELVQDGGTVQEVGMRFQNVQVPQGAKIVSADVQFTKQTVDPDNPTDVRIRGELSDSPAKFQEVNF